MKVLPQKELFSWLDMIAGDRRLIAPKAVSRKVLYRPVQDSSEIAWEHDLPALSAKDVLFPATERLLTIEKMEGEINLAEHRDHPQQVLFGLRPCDARGILALDAMFNDTQPRDDSYARRRENTTLVGIACQKVKDSCFCTSLGSSPHDTEGMDIMLTRAGESYAMEILTEKGARLARDLSLEPFRGELPAPPSLTQDLPHPGELAWREHFEDPVWEQTAQRCLGCRTCAYVCPACRCFDVRDESLASQDHRDKFERIRAWDSCMREDYRKIAGDHNPRAGKKTRLRNRVFCKFHYYPEQYGTLACTGCGRCIDACPVNIDIVEILMTLAQGVQV